MMRLPILSGLLFTVAFSQYDIAFAQLDPRGILREIIRPGGAIDTLSKSGKPEPGAAQNLSDKPSIDCSKVDPIGIAGVNRIARILCSDRAGAAADWDLNAALWAATGANNPAQQKKLDQEQDLWRGLLSKTCVRTFDNSKITAFLDKRDPARRLAPGSNNSETNSTPLEPSATAQNPDDCVIAAFHNRATFLRSKLFGDGLAESRLTPEQHAQIQESLIARGLLKTKADGEFGDLTRRAIKKFQETEGNAQTGFLTQDQMAQLRTNNKLSPPQIPANQNEALSSEEFNAMRAALAKNWVVPSGNQEMRVTIRVRLNPDGTLAAEPKVVSQSDNPKYQAAADSAVRAVLATQPFKMLKSTSYAAWKYMDIDFDPSQAFNDQQQKQQAEAKRQAEEKQQVEVKRLDEQRQAQERQQAEDERKLIEYRSRRNPNDVVAKVLNYSTTGKDEGLDDNFWVQDDSGSCRYRQALGQSLTVFVYALQGIKNFRTIDLNLIDPRSLRFVTKTLEGRTTTETRYDTALVTFATTELDVERLQRGWTLVYSKYCKGKEREF